MEIIATVSAIVGGSFAVRVLFDKKFKSLTLKQNFLLAIIVGFVYIIGVAWGSV